MIQLACRWRPIVLWASIALWSTALAGPGSLTYEYDEAGRLRKVTDADGAKLEYVLDSAGNRVQVNRTEAPARLQFGAASYSVSEAGSSITITVTRSGGTTNAVSVAYAATSGTATAGSDFGTASGTGTLNWVAGNTASQTFSISITNDTFYEGNEQFTVALSNPTGGAILGSPSQAPVTITDNDPAPALSIGAVSVNENAGTATFTVTKSGSTALTHTVNYATSNGTATAGADYTSASGNLSFTSATATRTFIVPITDDSVYEANETFTVTLSSPTAGATLGTSSATGTIAENEAAPSFTVNNPSVAENGGSVTFTVTKTGATVFTHAVNYATTNGSATAGSDYTAVSGTLTFTTAQTSKTVSVVLADDSAFEGSETFALNLSAPTNGATVAANGTATLLENDAAPIFAVAAWTEVTEGGSVSYNIQRLNATALTHQVSYATANGTAIGGSDYTAISGTVTFAPGDTNQFLTVNTIDDAVSEPAETYALALTGVTQGGTISTVNASATVTIVDNDNVPTAPQNLRTNPANTEAFGGFFDILWNASSGPVSYYQVEENFGAAYYQVTAPTTFRSFSYPTQGSQQWWYRVRACSASNQCSTWSNDVVMVTCPDWGCP